MHPYLEDRIFILSVGTNCMICCISFFSIEGLQGTGTRVENGRRREAERKILSSIADREGLEWVRYVRMSG
jgi:hypothetical protein